MRLPRIVSAWAVLLFIVTGCSPDLIDRPAPMHTVSDWVTNADQISVVKVISIRELPVEPPAADDESGLSRQSKQVRLVVVRDLWVRPGTQARRVIDYSYDAWRVKDGVRRPLDTPVIDRAAVGDEFVVPLKVPQDGPPWPMTPDFVVPVSGLITTVDMPRPTIVGKLQGKSFDEMTAILAATHPRDPNKTLEWPVTSGGR